MRAAAHRAVVTHDAPVLAAIIRTPQLASIGFLTVHRNAVSSFNQRVNSIGIAARDRQRILARHARRQSMTTQLLPGRALVARHEQAAARTAAHTSPRM